jgi:hypothetical protein
VRRPSGPDLWPRRAQATADAPPRLGLGGQPPVIDGTVIRFGGPARARLRLVISSQIAARFY